MTAKGDRNRKTKSKVEGVREESEHGCTHFWIIERPLGPTSKGVCKYCGAVKEFLNEPLILFNPSIASEEGVFCPGEGVSDESDYGEDERPN